MLKLGGRSATIVPQGVLFGSSKAHKSVRQLLVEENQLEAVIDMPSGVFKPYAGVATAVLVFVKGGQTNRVLFAKMESDGFTLDDKRLPDDINDIPEVVSLWRAHSSRDVMPDANVKHSLVGLEQLREQDYDLSFSRYFEEEYLPEDFEPPEDIFNRLIAINREINEGLEFLRGSLN